MVRRVVVLLVLVGFLASFVSLVKAVFGEDTPTAVGSAPEETQVTSPSESAETTPTGAVDPTSTSSTAVPDTGKVPTAADPARIYLAGDSDAGTFAPFLERQLEATGVADLTVDYKVSSGLARPDFFDWPARLREQIPKVNPDIVVVTFGGNDGQPIHGLNAQVDSAEWRAEYGKRVGDVMDYLSADGRTLIWVGIPNASSENDTSRFKIQDEVVRDQIAKHPNVQFVDAWERFTGINGGYAEYVVDPRDGESKSVRAGDGFHLNTTGAEIMALDVYDKIVAELRARGAAI